MNRTQISTYMIAREILRKIGCGRVGVVSMYDIQMDSTRVHIMYGNDETDTFLIPQADLYLSLDDFEDKWLADLPDSASFEMTEEEFSSRFHGVDSCVIESMVQ
jgi:hypothetical protein